MNLFSSFLSTHAPGIEVANIVFALLFGSFFYLRHREKYDALIITILGIMVGVIVRYFLDKQIGVGAGFGLFALFSILRFSARFDKNAFLYLFVSLSVSILSSLMQEYEIIAFLSFGGGALILIMIAEFFIKNEDILDIRLPVAELPTVSELVKNTLPYAHITRVRVSEIKEGIAIVQVFYTKKNRN